MLFYKFVMFYLCSYTGGWTATGTALQYVKNSVISNSAIGARTGAKKVIFVVTDGQSNRGDDPAIPAAELKSRGVIIFALGVTNNVRQSELSSIASSSSHVMHVGSYASLDAVTKKMDGGKCNILQRVLTFLFAYSFVGLRLYKPLTVSGIYPMKQE
jgi:hypothetical protein